MGLTAPLHVGAPGKALMAFLPADERERVLATLTLEPLTPETITDLDALRAELDRTRVRGYAVSIGSAHPGRRLSRPQSAIAAARPSWP